MTRHLLPLLCLLVLPACTTKVTTDLYNPGWTVVHQGVTRADPNRREIALVFTGGEHGYDSTLILDTLAERNIKASFFPTGDYLDVPGYDQHIQRMIDEGHHVGPHGHAHLLLAPWDDRDQSLVTESQFKRDLRKNINELHDLGVPKAWPIYFIPPYQWYNTQHAQWAADMGVLLFNFTPGSGSHRDWAPEGHPAFRPSTQILDDILTHEMTAPNGLNGHLLLLHLGSQRQDNMARLLPQLLDELTTRGYRFSRIDQILDIPKP
ncbi:polysaccharide deacetylase family protein [Mucisphaera sp.]|uniref:polysaccharide deacetylase family protein n=1 Tax=Mucisphaera sp. TaxID=2913024 RepID=UPI003D0AA247